MSISIIKKICFAIPILAASLLFNGCVFPHVNPPPHIAGMVQPPNEMSTIMLPVTIKTDLNNLSQQAESAIPVVTNHEAADKIPGFPNNFLFQFNAWRGPITFSFNPNSLTANTRAYYWINVENDTSFPIPHIHLGDCGRDDDDNYGGPRRADLGLTTVFGWTSDWQLVSKTQISPPNFIDQCKMSALSIDVTSLINGLISSRIANLDNLIDGYFDQKAAFIQPYVNKVWTELNTSFELSPNAWFQIHPQTLETIPVYIDVKNNIITSGITLTAQPEVVVGDAPVNVTKPIPPPSHIDTTNGFQIYGQVNVKYEVLSKLVTDALQLPRTIELGRKWYYFGHHEATITNIAFYSSGTNFVVDLGLSNPAGTIYLQGSPTFDKNTLKLNGFDFTPDTKSAVIQWFGWLLHGEIRDLVSNAINNRLPPALSDERDKVSMLLNSAANTNFDNKVFLTTKNININLQGEATMANDSIGFPVHLTGNSQLTIIP